jgi:hypothetical protein
MICFLTNAFVGCSAKVKDLSETCTPNGTYCATIVVQTNDGSNSSDLYHVAVKDMRSHFAWSHWANGGVGEFVVSTTEARPSRVVWSGETQLDVICDECRMQTGDVFNEKTHVGRITVKYVGFVEPLK